MGSNVKRGMEPLFTTIIIIALLVALLTLAFSFGSETIEEKKPEQHVPLPESIDGLVEGPPIEPPPGYVEY
ncbi:MAG: hypothetical protein ABIH34_03490 [Nanoarchaeota archaeon]